jgi:4-coumarate--CoA ligase
MSPLPGQSGELIRYLYRSVCNTIGWDPTLTAVPGSVGEPMPNCEIKLVDDKENEVAPGQRGEIWVRCPNVMKGYWDNPVATAEAITPDGWLKTGDVAHMDNNGYYYIVDRKKASISFQTVAM